MKRVFLKETTRYVFNRNGKEKYVVRVDILPYPNKRSLILSLDTCNQKVGSLTLSPPPLTHPVHIHTLPFWIFAQLILLLRVKFMSYSAESSLESMKKAGDCVIHAWDEFNQKPASLSLDTAKNGFSDAAAKSWSWKANERSKGWAAVSLEIYHLPQRFEDTPSSMFSNEGHCFAEWLIIGDKIFSKLSILLKMGLTCQFFF